MFVAWRSHRDNKRGLWISLAGGLAIIGYIIVITTTAPGKRYVGTFFSVMGIYGANALLLSWPAENVSPQTKRAVATAMQIFIGDIGAIAGVLIYRPSLSAHFFRIPHIIAIGYVIFGILIASGLSIYMNRSNRLRATTATSAAKTTGSESQEACNLGDRNASYYYQI